MVVVSCCRDGKARSRAVWEDENAVDKGTHINNTTRNTVMANGLVVVLMVRLVSFFLQQTNNNNASLEQCLVYLVGMRNTLRSLVVVPSPTDLPQRTWSREVVFSGSMVSPFHLK